MNILEKYKDYNREDVHDIFDPETPYTPSSGRWGLRGIVRIPNSDDFVFFVTFGKSWAGHVFKEGITCDGILSWQSQPSNKLSSPLIQKLIAHDHRKNNIYLFLRTNSNRLYTYLGCLKYVTHDSTREMPVYFKWQILNWDLLNERAQEIGLIIDSKIKKNDVETEKDTVEKDTTIQKRKDISYDSELLLSPFLYEDSIVQEISQAHGKKNIKIDNSKTVITNLAIEQRMRQNLKNEDNEELNLVRSIIKSLHSILKKYL